MQSAFPLPILGEGGVILHCDNPCILTSCAYRPVALPRKPSAVENRAFAPAWLNGILNSVLVITPWSFPDNYSLGTSGFSGFRSTPFPLLPTTLRSEKRTLVEDGTAETDGAEGPSGLKAEEDCN